MAKALNGAVLPLLDADRRPVGLASAGRKRRIPVAEPVLSGNESRYVNECLTTNWISSQGAFVRRFESDFAQRIGAGHALAVSNGTVALHLALLALGVGKGDEVIVPDLTFAATINAAFYAGATPVIVDVDRTTWNIDPAAIAAAITPRSKAIIPVHLYGQPAAMDEILALARRHNLVVIEDAAEAVGARYNDKACGAIGDAGTFSFFSNKLVTTGEGGMVVFRDAEAAERARRLRDHGMDPKKRYWHLEIGYNYRLTNLQAAIGCAQLEQLDGFLARKMEIAARYAAGLGPIPHMTLPAKLPGLKNSHWAYSIIPDMARLGITRDELADRLERARIETRPLFYPLHAMPPYKPHAGNRAFPNTDWLSENGISLPSAVSLTDAEIDYICGVLARLHTTRRLVQDHRIA
ncbi:MAG: DegT/DnrJ/EryC1/StrS family aminotransferase [Proteobacteria bacterium]|nr:DegT/DnrJ/EryC1/StrS family aminotransferase [Pseudomonadota bacterium]